MAETEGIETGPSAPGIKERLEGDRKLTEEIVARIQEKETDFYFYGIPESLYVGEGGPEHLLKILPSEEVGKEPGDEWFKVPVIVEITRYATNKTSPCKTERVRIDFPKREERQSKGQPWVYSVDEKGKPDRSADHQNRVKLTCQLLTKGVPLPEILGEGAEKLGLKAIRDLLHAEAMAALPPEYAHWRDEPLKEAVKVLGEIRKEKPILTYLVVQNLVKKLEGKRGQQLVDNPNWKVLERAFREDVLALVPDLFGRLPPGRLLEEFGVAREEVGVLEKEASLKTMREIIAAATVVGSGVSLSVTFPLLEKVTGVQLPQEIKKVAVLAIMGGSAGAGYWEISRQRVERKLRTAKERAAEIKEMVTPSRQAVGGSEQ